MKIDNKDIASEARKMPQNIFQNTAGTHSTASTTVTMTAKPKSFADVLNGEINQLQFSKHANMRINSRDIDLSPEQLKRVEDGVRQADSKGVRDSLVLVDNVALVVNIRSKTVITAVNKQQADKNIFTNIDGAVIV